MSQFDIMQLFYSRKNVVRHAVGVDHCVVRVQLFFGCHAHCLYACTAYMENSCITKLL